MRKFVLPPVTLTTASASALFVPGMLWTPAAPIVLARVQWEVYQVNGNATCAPAWQVATNVDAPGATQIIDPEAVYKAAVDVYYPTDLRNLRTDGTAPLKSNMLVRFGWLFKLSAGSTLAFIMAGGVVETFDGT